MSKLISASLGAFFLFSYKIGGGVNWSFTVIKNIKIQICQVHAPCTWKRVKGVAAQEELSGSGKFSFVVLVDLPQCPLPP